MGHDLRINWQDRLPHGPCVLVGEQLTPVDDALLRMLPGRTLVLENPDGPEPDFAAELKSALEESDRICVLFDAHLTKGGNIEGLDAALNLGVPVVPIYFDGPWSNRYKDGPAITPLPRKQPWPVSLSLGTVPEVGDAGDSSEDRDSLQKRRQSLFRESLRQLEHEVWMQRKSDLQPLSFSMVERLRAHPDAMALSDATRGEVSCIKALTGAVAIGRAMKKHWGDQQRVGFLLPPSNAGALANMAAILQGRTVVNLNYTTGVKGMESCVRQAGLKTVLASKQFLHKGKIEPPGNAQLIYLEDVARTISGFAKLKALLGAKFLPYRSLLKFAGAIRESSIDDDHAIIFSSGSTGEPKGVPVTHFNVISNIEQAARALDLEPDDRLLHMLPFFHTFGNFLLWAGIHWGKGMVFLPNPLDAEAVGEMTQKHKASILVATPTFLQIYSKKCTPEQFASLRLVVAGAEKLPQPFAKKWAEKYGVPISEGYGCTECSPVIGVNVQDYKGQKGSKDGSIGRPLPGVLVKIVDPDTREELPVGEPGLLLVKGPNVMRGYLDQPEKTAEVLHDGWYTTGDIVKLDEDGFLTITDRLSRFAKIGGEMVPHGKVEEALHAVIESDEQLFAVTSIPDEKKGERLAVIHCHDHEKIDVVISGLKQSDLPNIFIPKPRDFVRVEELPVLGTGKMDLRALKRIAEEHLNGGA